jgi:hypothetical protein
MIVAGLAMLACWIASLVGQLPSSTAASHQRRGLAAVRAERWDEAMRELSEVVARAPRSTWAHFGRACALMGQGRRSGAGIELVNALQSGLLAARRTVCPPAFDPRRVFQRVLIGEVLTIVVPRARPGSPEAALIEAELRRSDTDIGGEAPDAHRVLVAACLAWRARYYGLAYRYGQLAAHPDDDRSGLKYFLGCIGPRAAERDLRCARQARHLGQCAFLRPVMAEINRDERLGTL